MGSVMDFKVAGLENKRAWSSLRWAVSHLEIISTPTSIRSMEVLYDALKLTLVGISMALRSALSIFPSCLLMWQLG